MYQQQQQQEENDKANYNSYWRGALAAYASAALSIVIVVVTVILYTIFKNMTTVLPIEALLGIGFQVLLLGVVAVLPCPSWARICGYGARFIHIIGAMLLLYGVSMAIATPISLAGGIIGAIWIAAASWKVGGATRIVGISVAIALVLLAIVPSLQAFNILLLLIQFAWLLLIAQYLRVKAGKGPSRPKSAPLLVEWS